MAQKVCGLAIIYSNTSTFSGKAPVGTIVFINIIPIIRMMCRCERFLVFEPA